MKLKSPSSPGSVETGAEEVVGLAKQMLDDIAVKIERTSDAQTAVLIGTDPGDVYESGAHFKELARPKLPELKKAAFSLKIEQGPRARVAQDGRTAYVAANVVLRLGSGKKVQTLPTFRALWLFHSENEKWALISEHQSLGLMPAQRLQADDEAASDAGTR
jgi:hypothetical protein